MAQFLAAQEEENKCFYCQVFSGAFCGSPAKAQQAYCSHCWKLVQVAGEEATAEFNVFCERHHKELMAHARSEAAYKDNVRPTVYFDLRLKKEEFMNWLQTCA